MTVYQLLQNKLHENKESRVKKDAIRFIEVPRLEYVLSSNSTLGTRFTTPVCSTISKNQSYKLVLPILLATIHSVWFSKLFSSKQSTNRELATLNLTLSRMILNQGITKRIPLTFEQTLTQYIREKFCRTRTGNDVFEDFSFWAESENCTRCISCWRTSAIYINLFQRLAGKTLEQFE